ncbi:type VI secretion system-associated FHA domain protein [Roseibium sp. SCP14]|uniref:type VI secretion system-associated FHA domain protein n=1 Tax=Roseibium sp. SCP14 TaxID=3141375 RepID=UPI0033383CD1
MSATLILVCDKIGSRHEFGPNGGAFGRSRKCDWVLPDQERHLSSVHARIIFQNDTFVLVDESTNGTFLEGHKAAIGRGRATSLSAGMKLQAGPYVIRVENIQAEQSTQTGMLAGAAASPASRSQLDAPQVRIDTLGASLPGSTSLDPLDHLGGPPETLAPVASVQTSAQTIPEPVPFSMPTTQPQPHEATRYQPARPVPQEAIPATPKPIAVSLTPPAQNGNASLPLATGRTDPISPSPAGILPGSPTDANGPSEPVTPPAASPVLQPVPSSPVQDPQSSADIIPEDFLAVLTNSAPLPAEPVSTQPATMRTPARQPAAKEVNGIASQAPGVTAGEASKLPPEALVSVIPDGADFGFGPTPSEQAPVKPALPLPPETSNAPQQATAPAQGEQVQPAAIPPLEALKKRRAQREAELAEKAKLRATSPAAPSPGTAFGEKPSPVSPSPASAAPKLPSASDADSDVFQALLSGLGFADASVSEENQATVAKETGEMVRELAKGLIALLSARKSLKSEFRMYETRIQPEENNPFKHFNVGELAIDEMLFSRKGGFQEPAAAAKEAFKDLQSQNMITIAATQRAMRLLFESLSPEILAGEEDDGGLRLKGLGSRRGKWEAAKERHDRLRTDFDAIVRQTIAEAFVQIEEEQARQQAKGFWGNRK